MYRSKLLASSGLVTGRGEHVSSRKALLVAVAQRDHATAEALLRTRPGCLKGQKRHKLTPLGLAAATGDASMCTLLLEYGADIKAAADGAGATPLILAAFQGHTHIIQLLLNSVQGANAGRQHLLAATTRSGETAFMAAAKAGHLVTMATLAGAGSDVAAVDTKGRNALMLAAKHNQPAAVEQLVGLHKLSCSSKDTSGATCLMHAAAGGAVQVVQLLLQQAAAWKVDILAADSEGSTAAAHAVKGGSVAVLETLLAWGVPLYWQPPGEQDQGVPPAVAVAAATAPAAAMAGVGTSQLAGYQVPGVGTGLQCPTGAGWGYGSPGSVQATAVGAATSPGWGTVAPLQPPLPPPSLAAAPAAAGGGGGMRAAGTTAAAGMGPAGPTAAAAAASSVGGNWTTTHSSRAASPTPGAPGVGLAGSSRREAADGRLLSAAARHGHPQVVEWLLSKGIGARLLAAADGANPLFAGVEGGNLEVLQLLLDAGCVLNPRDQDGWAPLTWAAARGNCAVIKFLVIAGADMCVRDREDRVPRAVAYAHQQYAASRLLAELARERLLLPYAEREEALEEQIVGWQQDVCWQQEVYGHC